MISRFRVFIVLVKNSERLSMTIRRSMVSGFMVSRFMICRSRFMVGGFRSLVFRFMIGRGGFMISRSGFMIGGSGFMISGFRSLVFGFVISRSRCRFLISRLRFRFVGRFRLFGFRLRLFVAMIEDGEWLRMTIRGSMVSRFMIGGFMISRSWSISRFGFRSIRGFRFSGFYISRLRFLIGWLRLMIGRFRGIRRFRSISGFRSIGG